MIRTTARPGRIRRWLLAALAPAIIGLAGTAQALPAPRPPDSCASVRAADAAAPDGEYVIYPSEGPAADQGFVVWCADMAGTPAEYLTLPNTGPNANYGYYRNDHRAHGQPYFDWGYWIYGGAPAHTSYPRVRLDPVTLTVDPGDTSFAVRHSLGVSPYDFSSPGFKPVPADARFGEAHGCNNMWLASGKANIDLTGTAFAIADDVEFVTGGWAQAGSATVSSDRKVANLTGGGWCGGTSASGGLRLSLVDPLALPPHRVDLVNAGFETGDLTGWSHAGPGAAGVSSAAAGLAPSTGSRVGYVQAGSADKWVELSQTVTVRAGDSVGGAVSFKANDYLPFNDAGQVAIFTTSGAHVATPFYSNVGAVGWNGQTPWTTWSHTFGADGTYVVKFMTINSRDSSGPSQLFIDIPAPKITVTGVANAANYGVGEVPDAGCAVESYADGPSEHEATLSALEGPHSEHGLGTQTATCSYTDSGGLTTTAVAAYVVSDKTAPTLVVPTGITAEADSANGAPVTYEVLVDDLVDDTASATCSPAAGSTFAVGTTTVSCSAADYSGNTTTKSFTVTVVDTTAPELSLPATVTFEATSADGAVVTYAATASDAVTQSIPVICDVASGATVNLGLTTVSCTATDAAGNVGSGGFHILIEDTTAPAIVVPADFDTEATGATGAAVTFSTSATDIVDGDVGVGCDPASGSLLPLGATPVGCSATDAASNTATAGFTASVVDTTPPALSLPAGAIAEATGPDGASVDFTTSASDVVDGNVGVICDATAGAAFAVGETTVTCSATDVAGNTGSGSFTVAVVDTTAPVLSVDVPPTTTEATGPDGAAVSFVVTASDIVSGEVDVTCSPASGATFGLGDTVVGCSAVDAAGNAADVEIVVEVVDTTAPAVAAVADITVDATSADGATATIVAPTASDIVSGDLATTCDASSATVFPIGTTTVSCSATDAAGNTGSTSFVVTVLSAEQQLDNLETTVAAVGSGDSLTASVDAAQESLAKGNVTAASNQLDALVHKVNAQKKKIDPALSTTIISSATNVKSVIGSKKTIEKPTRPTGPPESI